MWEGCKRGVRAERGVSGGVGGVSGGGCPEGCEN